MKKQEFFRSMVGRINLIFLVILFFGNSFSQNKKLDSLLALLKTDKEDSNKVSHLNAAGWQLMYNNADTSIILSRQALALAQKLKWKNGIAFSFGNLGVYNRLKANYPEALSCYFNALKINEESGNKNASATNLGNIGIVYSNQADYSKALEYYLKALKLNEELNNKSGIAIRLSNIGLVYFNQANYTKALDYYSRALKINEELGNKNGIAVNLGNIGSVYGEQSAYPTALEYYLKALKIDEELDNKNSIAIRLSNIGTLYMYTKKYSDAYNYLYRALALSDSIGAKNNVKTWYELLSTLYEKSTVPLPDSIGGKLLNLEQMRLRSLYYFQKFISIRDTLFSEENKKQLVRKEMSFEFEKKEASAKAEQLKNAEIAKAESKKQKIIILSVICCLLLVAGFAGFIFRALRITRKQKILIEHQKHLVDEKQKEILDSIYYARRIQRALITNEKYISKNIKRLKS